MDFPQRLHLPQPLRGEAHQLRTGFCAPQRLSHRAFNVVGRGVCHGLQTNRVIAADEQLAHPHAVGLPTVVCWLYIHWINRVLFPAAKLLLFFDICKPCLFFLLISYHKATQKTPLLPLPLLPQSSSPTISRRAVPTCTCQVH